MHKSYFLRMILQHAVGNIPAQPQQNNIAGSRPGEQDAEKQKQDITCEPAGKRRNVAQQKARHHKTRPVGIGG